MFSAKTSHPLDLQKLIFNGAEENKHLINFTFLTCFDGL